MLALKEWLLDNLQPNLPNNPFQRAVKYMLKRWDGLIEYTNNGILRPDNNLIENQIRPLALGRKNFMFAASHQGAEYAAIFYSFFAMCKINDIDPHRWLTDVYLRIDNHNIQKLDELLPTKDYQFLSV
ncbi:MAG: transposase [Saprospiraceae bacterium]|nr:transposase [Saprospiraceae bacterium]